jgi:type 2 lantibiotic biosynthesis protein LanM
MKLNSVAFNTVIENSAEISVEDWLNLAEKALSFDEIDKLDSSLNYLDSKTCKEASRLLKRWEKLIQTRTGEKESFDRRLAQMGLNRNLALDKLQIKPRLNPATLPNWARCLEEIVNEAAYPVSSEVKRILADIHSQEYPMFAEFLHPFISYYFDRFTLACPDWKAQLTIQGFKQLVHNLLFRLSQLCARTVAYDLKQKSKLGLLQGKTASERYRYYVDRVLGRASGLFSLLNRYPVLGRLLATITQQAVKNNIQWFKRLKSDRQEIAKTFAEGNKLGLIADIQPGLSDPHAGGQTVWSIKFEFGLKLAYKPRDLAADAAYIDLIDWLNQTKQVSSLRAARILARQGYGWVEWIEASDCQNHKEVAQYYQRQGVHLAVFYFLCGNDFHEENFIAAGALPIPIDLEGIGSLALAFTAGGLTTLPLQWKSPVDSVVFTSMLPRWQCGSWEKEAAAMAGIAGRDRERMMPLKTSVWYDLETDRMQLKSEFFPPQLSTSCLPKLKGKSVKMQPFLQQVLDSFIRTYRTFLDNQDLLLNESSPLANFQNLPTRVLARNTQEYANLLFWTTAPDNLTSGKAYDIALEVVCGSRIDDNKDHPQHWSKLWHAEKKALWQRDIPYFHGSTSKCDLSSDGEVCLKSVNEFSGYELIQQRLQAANHVDLNWQCELIRATFEMFFTPRGAILDLSGGTVRLEHKSKLNRALASKIERHLFELGETISKLAVRHEDGIGWLTFHFDQKLSLGASLIHPMPWTVLGTAGTAVFLANLAAYTGNDSWATLALEAAKSAGTAVRRYSDKHPLFSSVHTKGLNGLPIVIYALLVCSNRLNNKSCLDLACELAIDISVEEWRQVVDPDLLNGSGSALLTLVQLYQQKPDPRLLERAEAVAQGMLLYQLKDGSEAGGFKTPIAPCALLGMAHGSAGIAYALSSLYKLTGDPQLCQAIQSTLAYERSHFDREHQDWPNLQSKSKSVSFMNGWCSGASGIGLARLEMLEKIDDRGFESEIETAIQATLKNLGGGKHHLCCGEAGRIIFLVRASIKLNRPDLYQAAAKAASTMLNFYEQQGFWKLQMISTRSIIPGLTDGVSGVGLALLTLLEPEKTSRFLTLS